MSKNTSKFNALYEMFDQYIFVVENDQKNGLDIVFDMNSFEPYKYKNNYGDIVEYLMYIYVNCQKKAESYEKKQITIQVHVENCTMKNFSIRLFKYLMNFFGKYMDTEGDDFFDYIYIHSKSGFFSMVYNMIKLQLNPRLKQRMILITTDNNNKQSSMPCN